MPANSVPAMIVNAIIWICIFGGAFMLYRWYKKKSFEAMFKKDDIKKGENEKHEIQ